MTTNRTPRKHAKRWDFLSLECKDRPVSLEQWQRHREEIMRFEDRQAHRPVEWWLYERNMKMESGWHQAAVLYYMNELRPEELKERVEWWRRWFDNALSPHCFEIEGASDLKSGSTIIRGLEVQRNRINWAGIPSTLVKQWNDERREAGLECFSDDDLAKGGWGVPPEWIEDLRRRAVEDEENLEAEDGEFW